MRAAIASATTVDGCGVAGDGGGLRGVDDALADRGVGKHPGGQRDTFGRLGEDVVEYLLGIRVASGQVLFPVELDSEPLPRFHGQARPMLVMFHPSRTTRHGSGEPTQKCHPGRTPER